MAKEDWSLGAHHLQYIYETFNGTSEGAQEVIEKIKDNALDLESYDRVQQFLDMFDVLREYNVAKGDPWARTTMRWQLIWRMARLLSGSMETGHGPTWRRQAQRRMRSTAFFHTL